MSGTGGPPDLQRDAVGTWLLDSYVSTGADGTRTDNFGASPIGQAMFDSAGHFSMTVVRSDLPRFATSSRDGGSPAENQAVVRGSLGYFGTYAGNAAGNGFTVTIAGATLPNWIGTVQDRVARMPSRDVLEFTNASASGGGAAVITWRRT